MTFHHSDRAEYLRSRRKLCDETLMSLTAYFESGFNARVADSLLHKLRDEQVRVQAQNEYRHELQAWYHVKLKRLANNRKRKHSWQRDDCDGGSHGGKLRERSTYRERKPDARGHGERKTAHEQAAKNKPCHVHGPESKHLYNKCRTNPKNQRSANNNNYNKRAHDAHNNDEREHESVTDSPQDTPRSPEYSNGEVSAGAAALPIENYHLDALHIPKKRGMGGVPHKSPGPKALVSSGSDTQRRMSLNLAMDDMFRDDVSMDSFLGQIGDGKIDAFFN